MKQGSKGNKRKGNKAVPTDAAADDVCPAPGGENAGQDKGERKVAKTLLYNPASVLEAAAAVETSSPEPAAEPAAERDEVEPKAKRKVAKTIIFDTASVLAAAEAAVLAASEAQQATAEADSATVDATSCKTVASESEPSVPQTPKTKVAKTLLFDPAKVLQAANSAIDHITKGESTGDAACATTIPTAAPSAQNEPAAEGAKRKVAKTLLFDPAVILEEAKAVSQQMGTEAGASKAAHEAVPEATEEAASAAVTQTAEAPPVAIDASPSDSGSHPRPVAKTLLYDASKILAEAEAATANYSPDLTPSAAHALLVDAAPDHNSTPTQNVDRSAEAASTPSLPVEVAPGLAQNTVGKSSPAKENSGRHPVFDEPPPELNIDAPPVRLFFESPLPEPIPAQSDQLAPVEAKPNQMSAEAAQDQQKKAPADPYQVESTAAVQAPEEKPRRRVPRTLLFNPVIGEDGVECDPILKAMAQAGLSGQEATGAVEAAGADTAPMASAPGRQQKRISTKKIAKTLIYNAPQAQHEMTVEPAEAPLNRAKAEEYVERYIAKTMLDHDILFAELNRSQSKIEAKARAVAEERALEPFKPFIPIECSKKALPCDWTWDETYSSERYRYCGQCQRPVYNFAGLEIAEAEVIILKAENRSKYTLYKRTDGKIMTSDCPVAIKKRSDFLLLSIGGVLAAVVLVVYMMTLPKPKPALTPAPVATAAPRKNARTAPVSKGAQGSGHYEEGKGFVVDQLPAQPAPVQPAPVAATSGPDTDENPVWEYPQGANQPIIDPRAPAPIQRQQPQPASIQPAAQPVPAQSVDPNQQGQPQPTYVKTYP
jgi:hypothetical protein